MVAQYDNILQAVNVSFTVGGKVGIVDSSGYVETKNVLGIKIMRLVHSRYDINYYILCMVIKSHSHNVPKQKVILDSSAYKVR